MQHKDINIQIALFLGFEPVAEQYGNFGVRSDHSVLLALGDGFVDEHMASQYSRADGDFLVLNVEHLDFVGDKALTEIAVQYCQSNVRFCDYPEKNILTSMADAGSVVGFINWLALTIHNSQLFITNESLCIDDVIDASWNVLTDGLPHDWLVHGEDAKRDFIEQHICERDEGNDANGVWSLIIEQAEMTKSKSEYFIFGESACRAYGYKDFDVLLSMLDVESPDIDMSVCEFKTGALASDILDFAEGWLEYAQISKEDFDAIVAICDKRSNKFVSRVG